MRFKGGIDMFRFRFRRPTKNEVILCSVGPILLSFIFLIPFLKYMLFYDKVEIKYEKEIGAYTYYYNNEKYEMSSGSVDKKHVAHNNDKENVKKMYISNNDIKLADDLKIFKELFVGFFAGGVVNLFIGIAFLNEEEELDDDYWWQDE